MEEKNPETQTTNFTSKFNSKIMRNTYLDSTKSTEHHSHSMKQTHSPPKSKQTPCYFRFDFEPSLSVSNLGIFITKFEISFAVKSSNLVSETMYREDEWV